MTSPRIRSLVATGVTLCALASSTAVQPGCTRFRGEALEADGDGGADASAGPGTSDAATPSGADAGCIDQPIDIPLVEDTVLVPCGDTPTGGVTSPVTPITPVLLRFRAAGPLPTDVVRLDLVVATGAGAEIDTELRVYVLRPDWEAGDGGATAGATMCRRNGAEGWGNGGVPEATTTTITESVDYATPALVAWTIFGDLAGESALPLDAREVADARDAKGWQGVDHTFLIVDVAGSTRGMFLAETPGKAPRLVAHTCPLP